MAGIYIHIPYCRKACDYCNFHFSTSTRSKMRLLEAIKLEFKERKYEFQNLEVETIYFGGGTPSILHPDEINSLLEVVYENYSVIKEPEITLESNPDDLNPAHCKSLKNLGINRLSIGIQSFDDKDLQNLGRVHSSKQAINAINNARDAGIDQLTIDLIYGIPGGEFSWGKNLEMLVNLNIKHFSAYILTVEPKTILSHKIAKLKAVSPDEEMIGEQFIKLLEFAKNNDFLHYEISNFAKEGWIAKHNSNYWKGIEYMGVGPSSHSYNKNKRRWNIGVNEKYIELVNSNQPYFDEEILSPIDHFNEYLMLGLRTIWGCDLKKLFGMNPTAEKIEFYERLNKYIQRKLIFQKDNSVYLTPEGILLSDSIISDLFIE